eukprot:9497873-Pyramimonas_sp.AAC.1
MSVAPAARSSTPVLKRKTCRVHDVRVNALREGGRHADGEGQRVRLRRHSRVRSRVSALVSNVVCYAGGPRKPPHQ